MELAFDIILALTLVYVGWRSLFSRDLLTCALFFVVFGLLMALAWVRLLAPDIALAEAAVSAGLTGTLFLRAAGQLRSSRATGPGGQAEERGRGSARPGDTGPLAALRDLLQRNRLRPLASAAVAVLSLGLLSVLMVSAVSLQLPGPGLAGEVVRMGEAIGIEQPVTAVLVVFRGYDTWLELAVLLATLLAVLGTRPLAEPLEREEDEPGDPLLSRAVRVLLPVGALVAGYLLWQGSYGPGGAFQGGAVVAAAIVLGFMAGHSILGWLRSRGGLALMLAGFAVPIVLTLPQLAAGVPLFTFPAEGSGALVILIEIAIGVSVALLLSLLLLGAEPPEASE